MSQSPPITSSRTLAAVQPGGPAVHAGGEQESGGLTPPYEGHTTSGEVGDRGPPEADANVDAAVATPADPRRARRKGGVGPAHMPGTKRGEDQSS